MFISIFILTLFISVFVIMPILFVLDKRKIEKIERLVDDINSNKNGDEYVWACKKEIRKIIKSISTGHYKREARDLISMM